MIYDNSKLQQYKKILFNFISKISINQVTGCWDWIGGDTGKSKYARFRNGAKKVLAHRFSYELMVEKISDDKVLDHICRNRMCVNPSHLREVTQKINVLCGNGVASKNALKTHCKYGHEFNEQNTKIIFHRHYRLRQCKECQKRFQKERYSNVV